MLFLFPKMEFGASMLVFRGVAVTVGNQAIHGYGKFMNLHSPKGDANHESFFFAMGPYILALL